MTFTTRAAEATRNNSTPRRFATALVLALAAFAASGFATGCSKGEEPEAQTYSGYVVDPPLMVSDVSLPDAVTGEEIPMPSEPGGLRLMYFGFLSCPDVCPTTLSDVKRALADMDPGDADRVQVSFATVDPGRDEGRAVADYLANFVDEGDALRTEDAEALEEAADSFGVGYQVETNEEGEVEVAHTPDLFAVNSEGVVVMQWPFGTEPGSLSRDLTSLLAAEAGSDSGEAE